MESSVQVMESSLVVPREAAPTKALWLSPVDLAATRGHTTLVLFYPSAGGAAAFSDVARLKEAMAKALVAFYPLAGRLGVDDGGRLEISCNGEGVLFVAARSSLAAQHFDLSKPSMELRRAFVPRVEPPSLIMAVQVTFFKCGGVALGVASHHVAVDGISVLHFLKTWSSFSRDGDDASIDLPCHDRALLRARSPPVVHPDALSVLYPKVALSQPSSSSSSTPTNTTEVFPISPEQLATLKRLCNGGGGTTSAFCAVSALVWRCAVVARRLPPDAIARLSFPVNVRRRRRRRRLGGGGGGRLNPPPVVPARYFGNALVSVCAAGTAGEIATAALASVAARVSAALDRVDDEEVVRSAVDALELVAEDEAEDGSGRRPSRGSLPETELRVVSWLSLPTHEADFGCGAPALMSRAESVRGGFVHVTDDGPSDRRERGGVRVIVCMEAANIGEFRRLLYANVANKQEASSKL